MDTKDKRELIYSYLENREELTDLIYSLINLKWNCTKTDLMNMLDINQKKIDTATPIDYVRNVQKIYPGIENANLVFGYNNSIHGELLNINNLLISKIIKTVQNSSKQLI